MNVLENSTLRVEFCDIGAAVHALFLKKNTTWLKLTAHPPGIDSYVYNNHPYYGVICGRTCNRIRNAEFVLGNTPFKLTANEGQNHLHGGLQGFSHKRWDVLNLEQTLITYGLKSPDGDQGYPGEIMAEVSYVLQGNTLKILFGAKSSEPTPFNLTNHTYFNLSGDQEPDIKNHFLKVYANEFLETSAGNVFTGKFVSNREQFPHLKEGVLVQKLIDKLPEGLDHCFVISRELQTDLRRQAELTFGNVNLCIHSTLPCLQIYSGYHLHEHSYGNFNPAKFSGIALESCGFPDAINCHFPGGILMPQTPYTQEICWEFT